jgi:hypothetical protein
MPMSLKAKNIMYVLKHSNKINILTWLSAAADFVKKVMLR